MFNYYKMRISTIHLKQKFVIFWKEKKVVEERVLNKILLFSIVIFYLDLNKNSYQEKIKINLNLLRFSLELDFN
jgi:hypothetical protein